jgi:hypothetical protein
MQAVAEEFCGMCKKNFRWNSWTKALNAQSAMKSTAHMWEFAVWRKGMP